MVKIFVVVAAIFIWVSSFGISPAQAARIRTSTTVAPWIQDALNETVPLVLFSPNGFTAEDYAVEWVGQPIPEVSARIGEKSLQWVRVLDVLVVPRGRVLLRAENIEAGAVQNAGFTQAFAEDGTAEIPIALVSGDQNSVEVRIKRGGREYTGRLRLRFRPRPEVQAKLRSEGGVYFDSSCSPYSVSVAESLQLADGEWAYVGCRLSYVKGDKHRTSSLELLVLWDGVGQTVDFGGIPTQADSTSLWTLRLRAQPGVARFKAKDHSLALSYRIADPLYIFGIGFGVGPYVYHYESPTTSSDSVVALPTIYASYFLDETMRIVGFGAGAISKNYYADIGLYLNMEQVRSLDDRLSLKLLLGGHVLGFTSPDGFRWALSIPQGIEVTYRDFLFRGWNATAGGFFYPPIGNRSYYNVWLRYGTGRWFAEANYIAWREPLSSGDGDVPQVRSRSVGISVGIPFLLKIL